MYLYRDTPTHAFAIHVYVHVSTFKETHRHTDIHAHRQDTSRVTAYLTCCLGNKAPDT